MTTRMLRTAPLLLAIALLAGCASAPATDATNSSAPADATAATTTASETPPQPVVEEEPAEAVVAFDGDCNALLNAETLSSFAAQDIALVPSSTDSLQFLITKAAARESGMLLCAWSSPTTGDWFSVVVAPLAIVPSAIVEATQVARCEVQVSSNICRAGVAVGNAWVAVNAYTEEAIQTVLASAGATLIGEEPQAADFPAGSWAMPECAALVPPVMSGMESPDAVQGYPSDSNPEGLYMDVLTAHGAFTYCGFMGLKGGEHPESVRSFFAAGAGLAEVEALGLPETSVTGADRAWRDPETGELVAAVGTNLVYLGRNLLAENDAEKLAAVLIGAMTVRAAA